MSPSETGVALVQASLAIDLVPVAAFISRIPDGVVVRLNARAADLLGGAGDDSVPLWRVLRTAPKNGDASAPTNDAIAEALQRGERLDDVDAVLQRSHTRIPVSVSIEPIAGPDGEPIATLTLCHCIAKWKNAATALHHSEQRLELALAAGKLGAWEFDLNTRALIASAQCKANHGRTPDQDFQLDDLMSDLDPLFREPFLAALNEAIVSRGAFEIEVLNYWPDGCPHWLFIAGRVVEPSCIVGVTLDVTERHRVAEALVAADRSKDEFMTMLGHELRTPISPIVTAVRLLQIKGPQEPELQRLGEIILRQTMQLSKLVDDLLDVGRIIHGKLRLERTVVDLNVVLRNAVETATPFVESRGHTLSVELPMLPIFVEADGARIVQVVSNLLHNAAKYMREGGKIELIAAEEHGTAVIRVRDEGVGIPPEMLGRVFQRFVQIESSTSLARGGLGIGLALVKVLVEGHGGTVVARSEGIGKGSEFTVHLPVAVGAAT